MKQVAFAQALEALTSQTGQSVAWTGTAHNELRVALIAGGEGDESLVVIANQQDDSDRAFTLQYSGSFRDGSGQRYPAIRLQELEELGVPISLEALSAYARRHRGDRVTFQTGALVTRLAGTEIAELQEVAGPFDAIELAVSHNRQIGHTAWLGNLQVVVNS